MNEAELTEIFEKGIEPTFAGFDEQTGKLCSFAQLRQNIADGEEDSDYPYEIKTGGVNLNTMRPLKKLLRPF